MPQYESPNWVTVDDEGHMICKKHMIPQIPCPACMSNGGDSELDVVFTSYEIMLAEDEGTPLQDLVAKGIDINNVNVIVIG